MASSILNSDDGVVSGTAGLKTSGGDDGILKIQTNGTDAVSVSGSQVCSFANNFGTVANLPAYQCRAWVNFDGTGTPAIRASGNVSSITDNGNGLYDVNLTTAMPDSNYCVVVSAGGNAANNLSDTLGLITDTSTIVVAHYENASRVDITELFASVFR